MEGLSTVSGIATWPVKTCPDEKENDLHVGELRKILQYFHDENQFNKLENVALCICKRFYLFFFGNPNVSWFCFLLNFQGLLKFRYSGPKAPGAKIK